MDAMTLRRNWCVGGTYIHEKTKKFWGHEAPSGKRRRENIIGLTAHRSNARIGLSRLHNGELALLLHPISGIEQQMRHPMRSEPGLCIKIQPLGV